MQESNRPAIPRASIVTLALVILFGWYGLKVVAYGMQWIAYKNPKTAMLAFNFDEASCRDLFGAARQPGGACHVRAPYAWEPSFDRERMLVVFLPDGRELMLWHASRDLQSIQIESP